MKRYLFILFFVAILTTFLHISNHSIYADEYLPRVVDDADLLTDSEENELLDKLDNIREEYLFDVVIVTVDTLDGKTPMEYADDYYDYNAYGVGSSRDGALLLLSMEDRDWHISTRGYGITAITDSGIDYMSDQFVDDLSDGNYPEAFDTFADLCEEFVDQAKNGKPYDVGHMPKGEFPLGKDILISIGVGLFIALVSTMTMRGKMKSVRWKASASDYIKPDSMVVTDSRDMFLYIHLDRVAIPKNEGGSSTHTSSSGASHGGGGGKF